MSTLTMTSISSGKAGDKQVEEVQSPPHYSATELKAQKSLLWKLDLVILPLLSLSYLIAYLDRNNIGYARLMGLQNDLDLSSQQFYNVVMVFYAGYLVCIFVGNLFIRKLGPKIVLGSAVVLFGVLVCCMCKARGYGDLIGIRFGVGCAESLLQSVPLYMAIWYGRYELGKRIAILYSATTISGVFAGLISYGIQKGLDGKDGRPSWQWLFIIEGVVAIGIGLANAAFLPTFPEHKQNSRFITDLEIKVARQRSLEYNSHEVKFDSCQIVKSLLDPKTYLLALFSGCNTTLIASTGAFLPTIVKEFGYSEVQAQLFTMIPYACAFVTMLAVGYLSDYCRNKAWFVVGSLTCSAIGLIICISTTGKGAGMFGACLLVAGAYPAAILQITWIQVTFCGHTKRAISWGVCQIIGQGLSMSGAQIYTRPPRFFMGHGILLGFIVMGIVSTVTARFLMARANKQRDRELREYEERGEVHPDIGKSFEETCDDHINFRYSL